MDEKKTGTGIGSKAPTVIGGVVIAVLAGAIGMQLARVQNGMAAEQDASQQQTQAPITSDQPVGRVNGDPITYDELARECIERHGKEVLDNLINRRLIQQACSEGGVTIAAAEVESEILRISKKFGLGKDQWLKMLQTERGLSGLQYRRDVVWPMLALKKLAGHDVKLTRQMLFEAYEDSYGPRVKARMMVLDNIRHAQEVWEKVRRSPEEFENYAREYSVEPNSRALGGAIPPIRRFSGADEEIRKAAFKMKTPGEISGVIQVDVSRYVILKFEGMTNKIEHDQKDVEKTLVAELREREVQKLVATTFEDLMDAARIDNYLTGDSKKSRDGKVLQTGATLTAE